MSDEMERLTHPLSFLPAISVEEGTSERRMAPGGANAPGAAKPPVPHNGRYLNDAYGNAVTKYQREKAAGMRRKNGALKLKKLTNRHMEIISLHIAGNSGDDIANVVGCTPVTVSRILNDPLARALIGQVYEDRQGEIDALAGDAISAVRDTLKGDYTPRTKLAAVDKFVKLKDSIGKQDDSAQTAEDVIARIFNIENSNIQINLGDSK